MAELLRTDARSVVKLAEGLQPVDVAALADAGLTAQHAVRKAVPLLPPATRARGDRRRRPRAHRPAVPAGDDPGRGDRRRPVRRGAGQGRRTWARTTPSRPATTPWPRCWTRLGGTGARGRLRLRRRARHRGRGRGDDPRHRVVLRHRLRRAGERADPGDHQPRDQHRRQQGRLLHRPARADGAGRPRSGHAVDEDLPADLGASRRSTTSTAAGCPGPGPSWCPDSPERRPARGRGAVQEPSTVSGRAPAPSRRSGSPRRPPSTAGGCAAPRRRRPAPAQAARRPARRRRRGRRRGGRRPPARSHGSPSRCAPAATVSVSATASRRRPRPARPRSSAGSTQEVLTVPTAPESKRSTAAVASGTSRPPGRDGAATPATSATSPASTRTRSSTWVACSTT